MKEISNSKELAIRVFELLKEVPWLKINGYSAYYLYLIASNSDIDYVILESARNEPFDMFVNDVKAMVNIMEKSPRGRTIFAYRINGVEKIFHHPIVNKINSSFEWYPKETLAKEKPKGRIEKKTARKYNHKLRVYSYAK
jgi:hypothetical protein